MPQRSTDVGELRREGGVTLLEVLLVVIAVGLLTAIGAYAVSTAHRSSELAACRADVRTVTLAAQAYYAKQTPAEYPASVAALVTDGFLRRDPSTSRYTIALRAGGLAAGALTDSARTSCV